MQQASSPTRHWSVEIVASERSCQVNDVQNERLVTIENVEGDARQTNVFLGVPEDREKPRTRGIAMSERFPKIQRLSLSKWGLVAAFLSMGLLQHGCVEPPEEPVFETHQHALMSDHFVTTWRNGQARILTTQGASYDVDWNNDGIFDEMGITTTDKIYTFNTPGPHTIRIRGITSFYGHPTLLQSVDQWGTSNWNDLSFHNNTYLIIKANDHPDLTNIVHLDEMFLGCVNLIDQGGEMKSWNVAHIESMSSMFEGAASFNGDVGNWDTSSVVDMSDMFKGASSFNQNIDAWNTVNVTNMSGMFENARTFNQNLNSWDVSNVTDVSRMFFGATSFNSSLHLWDTSSFLDISGMFYRAESFNSNISTWDTSNVVYMRSVFDSAISFNQDIGLWNVENVIDMSSMFRNAILFNGDIEIWDTNSLEKWDFMFSNARSFDRNIGVWNISNILPRTSSNSFGPFDCRQSSVYLERCRVGITTETYDNIISSWLSSVGTPIDLGFENDLTYCHSTLSRDVLNENYGWRIADGGRSCLTASDDLAETTQSQAITIPIVANDDFDADGPSEVPVVVISPPSHGSATIDEGSNLNDPSDDQVVYTPDWGFVGTDNLTYQIQDGNGDTEIATVTIDVLSNRIDSDRVQS